MKENIQKLKAVAKEVFGNLEDINLFTIKICMLNYVAQDQSRFRLLIHTDASLNEHFNFGNETFTTMTLLGKISTLEEKVKAFNSSPFHYNIIGVKFDSDQRTTMAGSGY